MNCRGHDKRVEIVNNYDVKCEAHIKLLHGMTIRSDAERDIINTYYLFTCKNKKNETVEKICCGEGAGRDLLALANIEAPLIFNMLQEDNVGTGGDNGNHNSGGTNNRQWHPAAKQLYNAIMILITAWNMKPGRIYEYKAQAEEYFYCAPFSNRVEKINKILQRNRTSMRKILDGLAEDNHLRDFRFDLLEAILHEAGIISYFEDLNGN